MRFVKPHELGSWGFSGLEDRDSVRDGSEKIGASLMMRRFGNVWNLRWIDQCTLVTWNENNDQFTLRPSWLFIVCAYLCIFYIVNLTKRSENWERLRNRNFILFLYEGDRSCGPLNDSKRRLHVLHVGLFLKLIRNFLYVSPAAFRWFASIVAYFPGLFTSIKILRIYRYTFVLRWFVFLCFCVFPLHCYVVFPFDVFFSLSCPYLFCFGRPGEAREGTRQHTTN